MSGIPPGWGSAKLPTASKKDTAWTQRINKAKTHWTATKAVNLPKTQRVLKKRLNSA